MERDQLLTTLRAGREVWEAHGVAALLLFGSTARGEAHDGSDVDLLVEFRRPIGLLEFSRLRRELEAMVGRPVDLVTVDALKPRMRDAILRDAVRAA